MKANRSKLLLHGCCAPCVTYPYQILSADFDVSVFFYNPNIQPIDEFTKRLKSLKFLSRKWNFKLLIESNDPDSWFTAIKGLEYEKEGEKRCVECYRIRLEKTAEAARDRGFDFFTTTLSVSPHKSTKVINRLGLEMERQYNVKFLESDFKKKDGFKISCQLSREEELYRQNYCGCLYSKNNS